ncbi:hypothetical protein [uncultured Jatrophihabitans sp.]
MHAITIKIRHRRDLRAFERAMRDASPTMQQELGAAAARSNVKLI